MTLVCFLLLLKRERESVRHLQPISSVWRPLAFLLVTLSTALNIWTLVGKVMSLLFNTLSRFVIAFLMRRQSAKELMLSNCGSGGNS